MEEGERRGRGKYDDGSKVRRMQCEKHLTHMMSFEDGESRSRPKECGWPPEAEAGDGPKPTASEKAGTQPYVCKEVNPGDNLDKQAHHSLLEPPERIRALMTP